MIDEHRNQEDLFKELISLRQDSQEQKSNQSISSNAMENSQQLMEQVIELLPDATLVINLHGQVVFWNKAMQAMTGITKDQMIGRGNYEYAIPFHGERCPILIDLALMPNGKYSEIKEKYDFIDQGDNTLSAEVYVPQILGGKGAYLWGLASILYDPRGNIYGAIQSIRDISDHKKAEKSLYLAELRFGKVFLASPIPISVVRREDGTFLYVNDSFLQGTGYTREEMIGRSALELKLWNNEDDHTGIFRRLQNDEKVRSVEIKYCTKQGQLGIALMSMEPIVLNETECLLSMYIDMTERRQMEKDIARLDRLSLIGEMAASIGHEIRNPMTAVRGFIQLLNEQECYENNKEYFELMIEELDRANGIISEYLGMAKDKIVDLHPQYLDLVVKAIYPMLEADANYNGMNIELDLGKPPMPLIDEKEIRQMIINMSHNSMEAMSPGGTLTIGTTLRDSKIILFIKDQGHGLDSEVIDKLGNPFVTTKDNGTGLGLAVCYSIAARHNAKIDYETGLDGTTFYISFPLPVE